MSMNIHGGPQSFQIWHHASDADQSQPGANGENNSIQQLIQLLEAMPAQQNGNHHQPEADSQGMSGQQDGGRNAQNANGGCASNAGDQLTSQETSQLQSLISQLQSNGGSEHLT